MFCATLKIETTSNYCFDVTAKTISTSRKHMFQQMMNGKYVTQCALKVCCKVKGARCEQGKLWLQCHSQKNIYLRRKHTFQQMMNGKWKYVSQRALKVCCQGKVLGVSKEVCGVTCTSKLHWFTVAAINKCYHYQHLIIYWSVLPHPKPNSLTQ